MEVRFTTLGKKFVLEKATYITANRDQNSTRWTELYITKSGNYIFRFVSLWQGEANNYTEISRQEALDFTARNGGEDALQGYLKEEN